MNHIQKIFHNSTSDSKKLEKIKAKLEPRSRYIIAITPRSGSSYLCDVMLNTRRFGNPNEAINPRFLPNMLKKIQGRTPEEYIDNFMRSRRTGNGISGFKASWFQYHKFVKAVTNEKCFTNFKYIYLTRRDINAQAVSLYKASESTIFHTNIGHNEDALNKLETLEYDFAKINHWYQHIVAQEQGWQNYFLENKIYPLSITYEEIEADILKVMKRIAGYISVNPDKVQIPKKTSIFKKVSDDRNIEWTHRFALERIMVEKEGSDYIDPPKGFISSIKRYVKF